MVAMNTIVSGTTTAGAAVTIPADITASARGASRSSTRPSPWLVNTLVVLQRGNSDTVTTLIRDGHSKSLDVGQDTEES